MGFLPIIREKCLLVKEKWAFVVDTFRRLCYLSWLCGWSNACLFVVYPSERCESCQRSSAIVWLAVVLGRD
jgi:hypothetical protein